MDNPTAAPRSAPPATEPDAIVVDTATEGSEPGPIGPGLDVPEEPEGAVAPTTEPPSRPTSDDVALLAFAQSFELTARDLYQSAIDAGAVGEHSDVFTTLMENHEEYGNVIAGIIGADAPQRRDDAIYEQFLAGFKSGSLDEVAQAGYDLESTAVATHTDLIGQLVGLDGATTLAAMLVIESRHCTVLAHLAGKGDDMAALLENSADPLSAPAEG